MVSPEDLRWLIMSPNVSYEEAIEKIGAKEIQDSEKEQWEELLRVTFMDLFSAQWPSVSIRIKELKKFFELTTVEQQIKLLKATVIHAKEQNDEFAATQKKAIEDQHRMVKLNEDILDAQIELNKGVLNYLDSNKEKKFRIKVFKAAVDDKLWYYCVNRANDFLQRDDIEVVSVTSTEKHIMVVYRIDKDIKDFHDFEKD